jgi:hypothetical protein
MDTFKKFFKKVNSDIDYDPTQLEIGIDEEMEHTNNRKVAETIAKHHLASNPHYYSELKKMEKKFDK